MNRNLRLKIPTRDRGEFQEGVEVLGSAIAFVLKQADGGAVAEVGRKAGSVGRNIQLEEEYAGRMHPASAAGSDIGVPIFVRADG